MSARTVHVGAAGRVPAVTAAVTPAAIEDGPRRSGGASGGVAGGHRVGDPTR